MLKYNSGFDSEYVTLRTNKLLEEQIKELYKRNGCWTWYDYWEWFNEESFMKDRNRIFEEEINEYGHIFPLNMIKVELPVKSNRISKIFHRLTTKLS